MDIAIIVVLLIALGASNVWHYRRYEDLRGVLRKVQEERTGLIYQIWKHNRLRK